MTAVRCRPASYRGLLDISRPGIPSAGPAGQPGPTVPALACDNCVAIFVTDGCQSSASFLGGIMVHPSFQTVRLSRLEGEFVIARLSPDQKVPSEILASPAAFISVTRTASELSIVCPQSIAPEEAQIDGPWSAWYVQGPIPFGMTGVVSSVVQPLSAQGIPVFVVSTFDSDLLMAPSERVMDAALALSDAGHELA